MVERIAELVREKKIDGISDLRDEVGPRRRARGDRTASATPSADVVLNQLYRFTPLQASSASTCWRSTAAARC